MLENLIKNSSGLSEAVVLAIVLILVLLLRRYRLQRRLYAIGGRRAPKVRAYLPLGLDFVYRSISAHRQHKGIDLWRSLFEEYGTQDSSHTIETEIAGSRIILTADPKTIQAVLAVQFEDFGKGSLFYSQFHEFLGQSIFTSDGRAWHDSRQMVRGLFTKQRVEELSLFERHTKTLTSLIDDGPEGINLTKLFYSFTLDVATDFLFGQTVGSMTKVESEFAQAIAETQRVQAKFPRLGSGYKLYPHKSYRQGIAVINKHIQPYIERAIGISSQRTEDESPSDTKHTDQNLITALGRSTHLPKKIRDEIISLLFAARDTTAVTLMWLFHELAARPDLVLQLRAEIVAVLGPEPEALPTSHDLKSMKLLHHVVNETLRLYPAVPINIRYALRDTVVSTSPSSSEGGGSGTSRRIAIRKGDAVAYSALVMQRRADLFPLPSTDFPPVDVFAPERWATWTPKPWTYIPFNGGPRICVGQQFALMEIWYTVTRVLQKYEHIERVLDAEASGEPHQQAVKTDIVGCPARDVRVRFWKAGSGKEENSDLKG